MKTQLQRMGLIALGLCSGACDPIHPKPSNPGANTTETTPKSSSGGSTSDTPGTSPRFEKADYQGITYFVQGATGDGGNKALHSGPVRIEQGCMYVGDSVVIWHRNSRAIAVDLIADLRAGVATELSLGGGGASLAENAATFPTEIQQACGATRVWYSDGKLKRPYSGCEYKNCGHYCNPCRADDTNCKAPEEAHFCNADKRCVGYLGPNACDGAKPDEKLKVCAGLDKAACGVTPGCKMVQGMRLDPAKKCKEPYKDAGCTSGDCGDAAMILANDAAGNTWVFGSGCYPDAWTEIESVSAPEGWDKWSKCGP